MLQMLVTAEQYYHGKCFVNSMNYFNSEEGNKLFPLSRDHKPSDELEKRRIIEAGGQIYQ